jgi:two-component system, OmpR family, aerobic respiration control sensor histidine kinase ArcB
LISDDSLFFTPEIVSEISPLGRACYRELNWPLGKDPEPHPYGNYILLVEDDEICTMVGQNTLRNMGHKVDGAMTGSEALEKALSKRYDLIFMDIGLPDIDGKEVTRKIRVAEKITNIHVPIVALTAHADPDFKEICIESGMDAVISKPISKEQVENVIRAFVPTKAEPKFGQPAPKPEILELDGEVLNVAHLKDDLGYDDDLIKTLVERAPNALRRYLADLTESYERGDWRDVGAHAHKIAGACAYCGAERLGQDSRRLSEALRRRKHEYADRLYNVVLDEAKEAIEELEKYKF